jgi:cytoskeletal protein CcmA (bactofilin family)
MFFKNKLFSKGSNSRSNSAEPTIIARDMTVEGNLICDGELHIDGTVIGSVRAAVCVIEATGSVTGEVSADALYVHGQINGPVDAGHVRIYAGSQVKGDVFNETISIEDGAYLHGSIRHGRGSLTSGQMNGSAGRPAANPFEVMDSAKQQQQPQAPEAVEDLRPIRVVNPRR